MQVPKPKIGIVEDLKPNAFTFGRGKKITLVCSIGLLESLDQAEIEAVLAHELAHIRNKDFNFKALTAGLKMVSFFNPLVYLLSSAISRQREILADEIGIGFLRHPESLGKALVKICEASKGLPSNGDKWQIASSLFIISPARRATSAFSSHPPIVNRLGHIVERKVGEGMDKRRILLFSMSCAFMVLLSADVYQTMASVTIMQTAGGEMGSLIVPASSIQPLAVFVIGAIPLGIWLPVPFNQAISVTGVYGTTGINVLSNSNVLYILLATTNVATAIAIVIGTFRNAESHRQQSQSNVAVCQGTVRT
jgi:hypothetical protein